MECAEQEPSGGDTAGDGSMAGGRGEEDQFPRVILGQMKGANMRVMKAATDVRYPHGISELRVQVLREQPLDLGTGPFPIADDPSKIASLIELLGAAGEPAGWFRWDVEVSMVFLLSTRRRIIGWEPMSQGTIDTLLMHPRDVFKLAIVANAQAIVIAHTHPSGDPIPSEADIRVTRDIYKAGQLLRIDVLDHVIVGAPALRVPGQRGYSSLRELGYFYS